MFLNFNNSSNSLGELKVLGIVEVQETGMLLYLAWDGMDGWGWWY